MIQSGALPVEKLHRNNFSTGKLTTLNAGREGEVSQSLATFNVFLFRPLLGRLRCDVSVMDHQ